MDRAVTASFALRRAHADDAGAIARLSAQLGYPTAAEAMRERLRALAARKAHCIRVAEDDHGMLGWIAAEQRLSLESGESIEIVGLVVDERAYRRGVGRALVASIEDWARECGMARVTVRSNVLREHSHPFYEGLGFTRCKTQHVYLRTL